MGNSAQDWDRPPKLGEYHSFDKGQLLEHLTSEYLSEFRVKERRHGRLNVNIHQMLPTRLMAYDELAKFLMGNNVPINEIKSSTSYYSESSEIYAETREFRGGARESGFYNLYSAVYPRYKQEDLFLSTPHRGCDPDIIYGVVDAMRMYIQLYNEKIKQA